MKQQRNVEFDFLAASNGCGQILLNLVSRGNAILAELCRLADHIPEDFLNPSESPFAGLLPDFSFFSTSDAFQSKLNMNENLRDLDEQLRDAHISLLTRFFLVFESVLNYAIEINKYVDDLDEGVYMQYNLETVLSPTNADGKQLAAELLYLYGVMLLVLEEKYPGPVRERLIVAYYRFNAERTNVRSGSDIDEVASLLRSTNYCPGSGKRQQCYPENYFSRVPLNKVFVDLIIETLRTDDLYNQTHNFPLADQRSTGLAPQAAMLYVCLYFCPEILNDRTPVMREIVDKYFPDNWVISIYMGIAVNLVDVWEPYKAARLALANSIADSNVRYLAKNHSEQANRMVEVLSQFLSDGTISTDYVLDNINKLLKSLRSCNVTLRWLMLHTYLTGSSLSKTAVRLKELVSSEVKIQPSQIFSLILNVSQFELRLKEIFRQILSEKEAKLSHLKSTIEDSLQQLADVFSGQHPLTRIQKNTRLQSWFEHLRTTVLEFSFEPQNSEETGGKIVQISARLNEVQDLHNLDGQMAVRQVLQEILASMQKIMRLMAVRDETLVQIQTVADFTYAWNVIDSYTPLMQEGIKDDPTMAIKLRATFLKLSSSLTLPLLRVEQAKSADLVSVSQFYSHQLVIYVRKVLQVVPETLFSLLNGIVHLQTADLAEMPTKLDKGKIKDYANFDGRYEIARLTDSISLLTEGILTMKETLVGLIRIDPKQVLEYGVRRELVNKTSAQLQRLFSFPAKAKSGDLERTLTELWESMTAFKRSFAYISDYISLSGHRLWQEELTRIIGYAVEQECNAYLKHKVSDEDSVYQSRVIPLPKYSADKKTFMGRLLDEIIKETNFANSAYVESLETWWDAKTQIPRISPHFFLSLQAALTPLGLCGLDRLCSFMIVDNLRLLFAEMRTKFMLKSDVMSLLSSLSESMLANDRQNSHCSKVVENLLGKYSRQFGQCIDYLCQIGQLQLIRCHLLRQVSTTAQFESRQLMDTLLTLNESILCDIQAHAKDRTGLGKDNALLYELSQFLNISGQSNPLKKIYICPPTISHFACILYLTILLAAQRLFFVEKGIVVKKAQEGLDGVPLLYGTVTVLKQFNPCETVNFVRLCAAHINSLVHQSITKTKQLSSDIRALMHFLSRLPNRAEIKNKQMEDFLAPVLVDYYRLCIAPST